MKIITTIVAILLLLLHPMDARAQSEKPHLLWRDERIQQVQLHAMSQSGELLALMNMEEIKIWNLRSGDFVQKIHLPYARYVAMAFSLDDTVLVLIDKQEWLGPTAEKPKHPTVVRESEVNLNTGMFARRDSTKMGDVGLALSPAGRRLVLLSWDGSIEMLNPQMNWAYTTGGVVPDTTHYPQPKGHAPIMRSTLKGVPQVAYCAGGRSLLVKIDGQIRRLNPNTLADEGLVVGNLGRSSIFDELRVIGDGIFIGWTAPKGAAVLYSAVTGDSIHIETTDPNPHRKGDFDVPLDAVLTTSGSYVVTRYSLYHTNPNSDVGPPEGFDTLMIVRRENPDERWGITLDKQMKILDAIPGSPDELLLGDGSQYITLNVRMQKLHSITPFGECPDKMLAYDAGARQLVEQALWPFGELSLVTSESGIFESVLRGAGDQRSGAVLEPGYSFGAGWHFPGGHAAYDMPISPDGKMAIAPLDSLRWSIIHTDGTHERYGVRGGSSMRALCYVNEPTVLFRSEPNRPQYFGGDRFMKPHEEPVEEEPHYYLYDVWPHAKGEHSFERIREVKPFGAFSKVETFDGNVVAVYGIHDSVVLYDVMKDSVVRVLRTSRDAEVYAITISQDNQWLYAQDNRGGRLWRISDGAILKAFDFRASKPMFAPNRQYLFYCKENYVMCRDLASDTETVVDEGLYATYALNDNGSRIATMTFGGANGSHCAIFAMPYAWRRPEHLFNFEDGKR